jgi:hypothetical protein
MVDFVVEQAHQSDSNGEEDAMATAIEQDVAIERDAAAWMEDPYAYFGESSTRIHSIERAEAETIQLAALNMRLEERREQIPVLAKLADGQGIARLASLDDAAPLLRRICPLCRLILRTGSGGRHP